MNIVKLKNKEGEEIFPITSSKAVFDENGESVYQSQKDLEGKASQVYENFAAIEASGETNVNKIYIDGETMIPYVYKGGFVPFSFDKTKVFRDINIYPVFYFKDGLFFYVDNNSKLCSWNEDTGETINYEIIVYTHPYNLSVSFPFIYKDGKIIVPTLKGATCYDLGTKEELWYVSMQYYNVYFNEYKDFVYLQDYSNKGIIKLIDIEDGSVIQEFNLSELSGETINTFIQDFGDCEINGYCYFSDKTGHIFKVSNENGYIEYVGKIAEIICIFLYGGYVYLLGNYYIYSMKTSSLEDGSFTFLDSEKHIQNTYLRGVYNFKIIENTIYSIEFEVSIKSLNYGIYIYETLDMSYSNTGKAIKGNKGYVRIKDTNTVNKKPFYVKFDWI